MTNPGIKSCSQIVSAHKGVELLSQIEELVVQHELSIDLLVMRQPFPLVLFKDTIVEFECHLLLKLLLLYQIVSEAKDSQLYVVLNHIGNSGGYAFHQLFDFSLGDLKLILEQPNRVRHLHQLTLHVAKDSVSKLSDL